MVTDLGTTAIVVGVAAWLFIVGPAPAVAAPMYGQAAVSGATDEEGPPPDPSRTRRRALSAQVRFERERVRHFPINFGGRASPCPETVGRFCTWYDEGDWYPQPEAPEIADLRTELIATLDSVQRELPRDPWVMGLRVWYMSEGGDLSAALQVANSCGSPAEPWFCAALRGYTLHRLGHYPDSEKAFEDALSTMDGKRADRWRVPSRAVSRDVRRLMEDAAESGPDSLRVLLELLWQLSDPLLLVAGNDRLTAHYARWTVATLRNGTRTAFGLGWGRDLDELTVRNGWAEGWERVDARGFISGGRPSVISHKHPDGRDHMPSARVLAEPWTATSADLVFGPRPGSRQRSMYAPRYAPLSLPMDAQIAFFPGRERCEVVAAHFLPEDTTRHVGHNHPRTWLEAGDQEGHPDRAGLFAIKLGDPPGAGDRNQPVHSVLVFDQTDGALALSVPVGRYLISVEAWSPSARRSGILRLGHEHIPPDPESLFISDLLLVASDPDFQPTSLREVIPHVLPRTEIERHSPVGVVWEMGAPPRSRLSLGVALSTRRLDRGVMRRVGEFLRVVSPRASSPTLAWEEAGPEGDEPAFRFVAMDFVGFEPGLYELRVEVSAPGHEPVSATRKITVR